MNWLVVQWRRIYRMVRLARAAHSCRKRWLNLSWCLMYRAHHWRHQVKCLCANMSLDDFQPKSGPSWFWLTSTERSSSLSMCDLISINTHFGDSQWFWLYLIAEPFCPRHFFDLSIILVFAITTVASRLKGLSHMVLIPCNRIYCCATSYFCEYQQRAIFKMFDYKVLVNFTDPMG